MANHDEVHKEIHQKVQGIDDGRRLEAIVSFLAAVMNKAISFTEHIDHQISILTGINTALFVFSIGQIKTNSLTRAPFMILAITAAVGSIISLLALHPPKFLRKRGQAESLFYNRHVIRFPSAEAYQEAIHQVVADRTEMINQFSMEVYNLYKYYHHPKKQLFLLSRTILLVGVVISLIAFSVSLLLEPSSTVQSVPEYQQETDESWEIIQPH